MATKAKTKPRAANADDKKLGTKIRARRVEIAMSQSELGDKLGVSFQQIQKYEKGVNRVSASRLGEIAKALDIGMDYFTEASSKNVSELFMLLTDNASQRLLRAFHKIEDVSMRYKFVGLLESVAEKPAA